MKVSAVTSYLVGALSPLNHIGLNPHKTRHFKANVKSKLIVCSSFRELLQSDAKNNTSVRQL